MLVLRVACLVAWPSYLDYATSTPSLALVKPTLTPDTTTHLYDYDYDYEYGGPIVMSFCCWLDDVDDDGRMQ